MHEGFVCVVVFWSFSRSSKTSVVWVWGSPGPLSSHVDLETPTGVFGDLGGCIVNYSTDNPAPTLQVSAVQAAAAGMGPVRCMQVHEQQGCSGGFWAGGAAE